jgi:hypothetical protein
MLKRNGKVYNSLSEYCNIEGEKVRIICPYNIQKYSLSFRLKDKIIPNKIKFDFGKVKNVELQSVIGLKDFSTSIEIKDVGFIINIKDLQKKSDYLIDIEYQMDDHRFMHSFVNTDGSSDTPFKEDEEKSEYWLEAHLKFPNILKDEYGHGNVELNDVDVGVNVSIGQDINMKIPSELKDKMKTITKLNKGEIGRSETFKEAMHLYRIHKGKYSGDSLDILKSLQDYFSETVFRKFVKVKQDFDYFNCIRGEEFYDNLPVYSWPKFMSVYSKCNLNLEKPAAKGTLLYKRKDFVTEITKILKLED